MPKAMETETFESRDLFGRAEVQIKRGRYREASALITQALKMAPDNPVYISYLGYCIGSLGNLDGGEKMCRRAMQLAPTLPIVLVNLGRILVEKDLRKEARVLFTQAYSIDNTNAPAALELSRLGVRRPPVFPFLKRNSFMNKYMGMLRHRFLELWNTKNWRIL
jgi:Flp pilus assembly protein TadD